MGIGPLSRNQEHFLVSLLMGVLLYMLYPVSPWLIPVCVLGGFLPDLDRLFSSKKRNPLTHSFLLPMLVSVIMPPNVYVKALMLGFASHMISDLDDKGRGWDYMKQGVGTVLLWVSFIIVLMLFFGVDLHTLVSKLFS